jgi:hypothetical protein
MPTGKPAEEFLVKIRGDFASQDGRQQVLRVIQEHPEIDLVDSAVAGPDLLKIKADPASVKNLQLKLQGKADIAPNQPLPDPRLKPTLPKD